MSYCGLLQSARVSYGQDGNPVASVRLQDPRDVLDGAAVVLGQYGGATSAVGNLLNVFGYLESIAYGNSGANDAGIPWASVKAGLAALCGPGSASTAYGGPLVHHGSSYRVDLSWVPDPPAGYRLAATSASLLELISEVCLATARDFYVELADASTIRVRTVSRVTQPNLGLVAAAAGSTYASSLVSYTTGTEARHDITSTFLTGGDVTWAQASSTFYSFWGYHPSTGSPLTGQGGWYLWAPYAVDGQVPAGVAAELSMTQPEPAAYDEGIVAYEAVSGPFEAFYVPAGPLATRLGSYVYACSELELRFALAGMASWLSYVWQVKRPVAALLGVEGVWVRELAGAFGTAKDLVNDRPLLAEALAADRALAAATAYSHVLSFARDHWGKRYLVGLPEISRKVDAETGKVTQSAEVADAAYVEEGSSPLGISPLFEDLFKTPDGRLRPLVQYASTLAADLTSQGPQGTYDQGTTRYALASVDQSLLFPGPYALLSLPQALSEEESDMGLDVTLLAAVFGIDAAKAGKAFNNPPAGTVGIKVAPAVVHPALAVVPLRSTVLTYGPWYARGADARTRLEHDPSLVPWNYGGYTAMNVAGLARVSAGINSALSQENAELVLAGMPLCGPGDALVSGGPNVTGMEIRQGEQGVTTTYRFSTFSPTFGAISKQMADRTRRQALSGSELRRQTRAEQRRQVATQLEIGGGGRAPKHAKAPKQWKKESPLDVVMAGLVTDSSGGVRAYASFADLPETVASIPDSDQYVKTAAASLEAIFRGYCAYPSGLLPSLESASGVGLTAEYLSPFKGLNHVEASAYGTTYEGLKVRTRGGHERARPVGLNAPLVLVGWGEGLDGSLTPSGDYLTRPDLHHAGPLDPLWDHHRGVWTVHDVVRVNGSVPGSGDAYVQIYGSGGITDLTLRVHNPDASGVEGDFYAAYSPYERVFRPLTGGGGSSLPAGDPYTVLHTPAGGGTVWEGEPTILGLYAGGSGVGLGHVSLGPSGTNDYLRLERRGSTGALTLRFPATAPSASGYLLGADTISGGAVDVGWQAPGSGATQSVLMPMHAYCDGTNLVVVSGYLNFTNGRFMGTS